MSEIQNQIKKWPVTAIKKIKSTFGSAEKFYATVYLIARNEHHCQMMGVAGAEQRLKTIHAYQGMIALCSMKKDSMVRKSWTQ